MERTLCEKSKRFLRIVRDGRKEEQVTGRVEDEIPREAGVTENFILLLNINTGGKDTHTRAHTLRDYSRSTRASLISQFGLNGYN